MAYTIATRISGTPAVYGETMFDLPSNSVVILYGRAPINAPLPGGSIILIDLGQQRIQITLKGKVDSAIVDPNNINPANHPTAPYAITAITRPTTSGTSSPFIATREDIEAFTREWDENIIYLTVRGVTYQVKIANANLTIEGGRDWWDFTINFVGGKPEDIDSEQLS